MRFLKHIPVSYWSLIRRQACSFARVMQVNSVNTWIMNKPVIFMFLNTSPLGERFSTNLRNVSSSDLLPCKLIQSVSKVSVSVIMNCWRYNTVYIQRSQQTGKCHCAVRSRQSDHFDVLGFPKSCLPKCGIANQIKSGLAKQSARDCENGQYFFKNVYLV